METELPPKTDLPPTSGSREEVHHVVNAIDFEIMQLADQGRTHGASGWAFAASAAGLFWIVLHNDNFPHALSPRAWSPFAVYLIVAQCAISYFLKESSLIARGRVKLAAAVFPPRLWRLYAPVAILTFGFASVAVLVDFGGHESLRLRVSSWFVGLSAALYAMSPLIALAAVGVKAQHWGGSSATRRGFTFFAVIARGLLLVCCIQLWWATLNGPQVASLAEHRVALMLAVASMLVFRFLSCIVSSDLSSPYIELRRQLALGYISPQMALDRMDTILLGTRVGDHLAELLRPFTDKLADAERSQSDIQKRLDAVKAVLAAGTSNNDPTMSLIIHSALDAAKNGPSDQDPMAKLKAAFDDVEKRILHSIVAGAPRGDIKLELSRIRERLSRVLKLRVDNVALATDLRNRLDSGAGPRSP